MASVKHPKNWIRTTSQDYSPGGALSLGQVLTDPFDASSGLLSSSLLPIPSETLRDKPFKTGVNLTSTDFLQTSFKTWLSDTTGIVAGASVVMNLQNSDSSSFCIDTLRVDMFQPSLAYTKAVLQTGDVSVQKPWYRLQKRLYLVTGLRIAEGTSLSAASSNANQIGGNISGDLSLVGAPISAGLGGDRRHAGSKIEVAQGSSSFVFAYRLHEIIWTGVLGTLLKPFQRGSTHTMEQNDDSAVTSALGEIVDYRIERLVELVRDGNGFDNIGLMDE